MISPFDPLPILKNLLTCASVTPMEAGVLGVLEDILVPSGFKATRLPFSEEGIPSVDNLYLRFGTTPPHFCFAGHVDVVPPGAEQNWRYPPFSATVADGHIWGRGACDMKGGIAAFVAAALEWASTRPHKGSVSLLLTGDEETIAINGTDKVLKWMEFNGEIPDHCLVGEPTSQERLGDGVKIGRRGSMDVFLTVSGKQGHVAYPHLVRNPIHGMGRILDRLHSYRLDHGNDWFEPSTLQCVSVDTGNPVGNIVPQKVRARFNIRYNTEQTPRQILTWIQAHCDAVQAELGGEYDLTYQLNSDAFFTPPDTFSALVCAAIEEATGVLPSLNTSGGTSDARFIKNYCPVVEFGPLNATIHQIDERIGLEELHLLTRAYRAILGRYFAQG